MVEVPSASGKSNPMIYSKPSARSPEGERLLVTDLHTSRRTGCIRKHTCIWKNTHSFNSPRLSRVQGLFSLEWKGERWFDEKALRNLTGLHIWVLRKKLLGEYTYLARRFNGEMQTPLIKIFLMTEAATTERMLDGEWRLVLNFKCAIKQQQGCDQATQPFWAAFASISELVT